MTPANGALKVKSIKIDDLSITQNSIKYMNTIKGEAEDILKLGETRINKYQPKYHVSQFDPDQVFTRSLRLESNGLLEYSLDNSLNTSPFTGTYHEAFYGPFNITLFQQNPEELATQRTKLLENEDGTKDQFTHLFVQGGSGNFAGFYSKWGGNSYANSASEWILKNYANPEDPEYGTPILVAATSMIFKITVSQKGDKFFASASRASSMAKINENDQETVYWKQISNGYGYSSPINTYGFRDLPGENYQTRLRRKCVDGIVPQIDNYVEHLADTTKTFYSRNKDTYTMENSWNRFVLGVKTFVGAIERVDFIPKTTKANFSGINTLKVPNIQSDVHYINREYGTLSSGEFTEFCDYLKKNGATLQSTHIKSIKRPLNKNHIEFIYAPDMRALPLNDAKTRYLEKSNITEYQLFPWGSHVKLIGDDVPEELKDVGLLVSNKGTREQKIPDVQRGTISEYYYNNFSQVTFKLPIILTYDKSFKYMLDGVEKEYIVPKGGYYIRDICDMLNEHLSPKVNCLFNYEENLSNTVKFVINNTENTTFEIVLSGEYEGNIESPENMTLSRILGFTSDNQTAITKTLYTLGTKNESTYQNYVKNNDLTKFSLIPKTRDEYEQEFIYTDRKVAWKQSEMNTFSSSYNKRTYLAYNGGWGLGAINGNFTPASVIIRNSLNLQDPLEFDESGEMTPATIARLMSIQLEVDTSLLTAYNSNKLSKTVHNAVKIGKDVDNRYTIEFELRPHDIDYRLKASVLDRIKAKILERDTQGLPQFGLGNIDAIDKMYPTDEQGVYLDHKMDNGEMYLPGGDLKAFGGFFSGWYFLGYRMFLKLGLVGVEATSEYGPFQFIQKGEIATDEFVVIDPLEAPYWFPEFAQAGFKQSDEIPFSGYSYATLQYDGYPGIFNYFQLASGAQFTHPYSNSDQSIFGSAIPLNRNFAEEGTIGNVTVDGVMYDILFADISEVKALVIENNPKALTNITDVKTSLMSEDVIDKLLNLDLNTTDLKLYKKIEPITNYTTIDNFLTNCFQAYNVIQSEEHSSFTALAREAGDGIKEYYPGLYSSIKNDWDLVQETAFTGGMITNINNRCNLHVIPEAENNTHGYDFTGELADSGKKGQFWKYPAHYEWSKEELPDGHYLKNDKYGGMSLGGKIYRSIANMVDLYEIHVNYAELPDVDPITGISNVRGGDSNTNVIDGTVRYTRFYGWPTFAKNQDPLDERETTDQEAVDECPLYGVFKDDVILKVMENQPEFMAKWNAGERPKVGYFRQGSVYWSAVYSTKYVNSGQTAVLYSRPDLKVHRLNFFNALSEPIYKLFKDSGVQYILMDERQNLGGSFDDGYVLFSRLGDKRPLNHSLELSPGWNIQNDYNNRARGRVIAFSEFSEFAKQLYELSMSVQDMTNYNIKEESLNKIPKEKFLSADEYRDTIITINPKEIEDKFPYILEDGNVEAGPVLIGSEDKPIRVLCNRSSVATSGGRLTGWNGVGKDGRSQLGQHCTFRQSGNWDRLFSTGGNYPYSVFDRETKDTLRKEGNSYDLFAEPARLEASGTLLFDEKNAKYKDANGNYDVEDVRNYVMASSTFDLPFNKVDFVLETGGYNTFFRSIGLTKQAVERLTKRKKYTVYVSYNGSSVVYDYGSLTDKVEPEANYIFEIDSNVPNKDNIGITPQIRTNYTQMLVDILEQADKTIKTYTIYRKHVGRKLKVGNVDMDVIGIGALSGYRPINLLNSAWVKTNVGMEGIQNIDFESLPMKGDPGIIFEEPLTHVDHYTVRNLQILLDQKTDNWTDMSAKYTTKELTAEQRALEVNYGGIDFDKFTGHTPEGNKYPSEILDYGKAMYGNVEFKTHNVSISEPYEKFTGGLSFVDENVNSGVPRIDSTYRKDAKTIRNSVYNYAVHNFGISDNLLNTEHKHDEVIPEYI